MTLFEPPVPAYEILLAGHLRESSTYRVVRSHGADDCLLMATLTGRGRLHGRAGEAAVHAGDLALLPPGVPHDYGVADGAGGWEFLFVHFRPRPEWLPLLRWPREVGGVGLLTPQGTTAARVQQSLTDMVVLARSGLAQANLLARNALEAALLWSSQQNSLVGGLDERLVRVMEHVARHLDQPVTVARLAEVAALSRSRLSALFAAQLGITPQRYVEQQRLDVAMQLLRMSANSVSSIASTVGFADPLYFTKRFRRHTGYSPTEFRSRSWSASGAVLRTPRSAP